jgi:hypothetical protein
MGSFAAVAALADVGTYMRIRGWSSPPPVGSAGPAADAGAGRVLVMHAALQNGRRCSPRTVAWRSFVRMYPNSARSFRLFRSRVKK